MALPDAPDEFALIAELFAPLAADAPGAFGLTDDAAVFTPGEGRDLVLTVDALVEGVHFLANDPPGTIARKLLGVNLSDLAAKGATPKGYLLTAAFRPDTPFAWMRGFAEGLRLGQQAFGLSLWGGDTVSTPGPLSFSLTALGEVPKGGMLRRSGARAGDDIYVTGTIGDGALGLLAAQGKLSGLGAEDAASLAGRYRVPAPRVTAGPRLIGVASAALDVSDGLMADLGHMCAASGVGALVETASLPLSPAAGRALAAEPSLLGTILGGGDDYEILFAAPPAHAAQIARIALETGVPMTRIGRLGEAGEQTGEKVRAIDPDGRIFIPNHLGFRHF
jgi:thiamine-monophosphate kinase